MAIISMVVMLNDFVIVTKEYGRRRQGLPNAPLDMEYDNNRTKTYSRGIAS